MDRSLGDFSAPKLAQAIEANLFEYLMDLDRSPQVTIQKDEELFWFLTGVPFPGFNRIISAQFKANDVNAKIEAALAPFKRENLPTMWHVGPSSEPADLGNLLIAHGSMQTAEEPGMAANLVSLDGEQPLPSGLKIEHVQDVETLRQWSQVTARAFDFPVELDDALFRIEASLGQYHARRLYLGTLEGEPVATALLFLGAGVAGIYGLGTIPQARRRGIGRAMTVAPLLEARAMGYQIGTLHSSPMGLGIYQQLGFREYCKLSRYVWKVEKNPSEMPGT